MIISLASVCSFRNSSNCLSKPSFKVFACVAKYRYPHIPHRTYRRVGAEALRNHLPVPDTAPSPFGRDNPQWKPHCHMVGKLPHKERFSNFRRTYKEVSAAVEKPVHNRRSRWIYGIIQFRHGNGLKPAAPGFLRVLCGLQIDLCCFICYNFFVIFCIRLFPICANR